MNARIFVRILPVNIMLFDALANITLHEQGAVKQHELTCCVPGACNLRSIILQNSFATISAMNTHKRKREPSKNDEPSKKQRTRDNSAVRRKSSGAVKWQSSSIVTQLEKVMGDQGNASDARRMKKYMRDKFDFYGIKCSLRREIMKDVLGGKDKGLEVHEIREFVKILWAKPQRELQSVAVDFLEKHKIFLCKNVADFEENSEFFKMLVTSKSWWDTVDMLAYKLVGYLVQTHPTKGKPVMQKWISSENMWLRRTAILHQLCRKETINESMLFQFCLARCHEEEFFIRKAIGWALRDYAKTKPNAVKKFLKEHKNSLSKLSFNEAAKHLKIEKSK